MQSCWWVVAVAVGFGGCGGGCSGGDGTASASAEGPHTPPGSEASGSEGHAPPAAAPPQVRVAAEVHADSRNVTVRVENRGVETASLRGVLVVQRRDGRAWADAQDLQLRFDCSQLQAPRCVTLAPGAVFVPPDWLGMIGHAQCDCDRCAPAPAGTYRVVAESCEGGHRVESEPFELPVSSSPP